MAQARQVAIGGLVLVAVILMAAILWVGVRILPAAGAFHVQPPVVHRVEVSPGQTLTLGVATTPGVRVTSTTGTQAVVTTTLRWRGRGKPPVAWSERQGAGGPVITLLRHPRFFWGCCSDAVGVRLALPAGVRLALNVANGPVTLAGGSAAATVRDVNGAVSVFQYGGPLALTVVTGGIAVRGLQDPGAMSVSCVNGTVSVSAAKVTGDLNVSTVNGTQRLSGMQLGGGFTLHSVNGAILYSGGAGRGGSVTTVNGAVDMRLAQPSTGHYVLVNRGSVSDWPATTGAELGQIVLATTNGATTLLPLNPTGGNGG